MRLTLSGFAVLVASGFACSPGDPPSPVDGGGRQIAGCFGVQKSDWHPAPPGEQGTYQMPSIAELTLEPDEEGDPTYVARPSLETVHGSQPGRWRRLSPDSLMLFWSDGYVRALTRLRIATPDSLVGRAIVFHDGGLHPIPEAEVVLQRIRC